MIIDDSFTVMNNCSCFCVDYDGLKQPIELFQTVALPFY